MDDIDFRCEQHIGIITLNRISALNALNLPMILALQAHLEAWQKDEDVHAVVIRSAGGRAFCAGGDVRAIYAHGPQRYSESMDFFAHEYRLNHFIHQFSKPYIALMDGITMGGGVGIALHGSHPVASENFVFAMPETGIGFYPDIGASHLLSRCVDHIGVYLGLTGHRISALESHALGLVQHVIPVSEWSSVCMALKHADLSTDADDKVTTILKDKAIPAQPSIWDNRAPFIHAVFQQTDMNAIMTTLQTGHSEWHKQVRHVLDEKSPLSLHITREQLRLAASLTLDACLSMDYCLTSHFMQDSDFYEGVRALLIDKDNTPHWQPSTHAQVSEAVVAAYFENKAILNFT